MARRRIANLNNSFFILLFLSCSCARVVYFVEQGIGQIKIQHKARLNSLVLDDPQVSLKNKEKIKYIEKLKNYFYKYFEKDLGQIYTKTTILEDQAVSYLVTASKFNTIAPLLHSFPFLGKFPYIGYFKKKSAQEFALDLEKKDYVTWIRPVYAYSSLGYFQDPILSSFFAYKKSGLTELIFHELYHQVLFIEDEVDLNENLANFFGKELAKEYLNISSETIGREKKILEQEEKLRIQFSKEVKILKQKIEENHFKTKELSLTYIREYFKKYLTPKMTKMCKNLQVEYCFPIKRDWNQASMTGFLTYSVKAEMLQNFYQEFKTKKNGNLKSFHIYLEKLYQNFLRNKKSKNFSSYLSE